MYEKERNDFLYFLNLTKQERLDEFGYTTQRDFAKDKGLPHEKILSEWKADPKFKKKQEKMFMDTFKDILPDARKTLSLRGIQDGDVNALKEIFKITGLSIERIQQIGSEDIEYVVKTVVEVAQDVLTGHDDLYKTFVKKLEDKLGDM